MSSVRRGRPRLSPSERRVTKQIRMTADEIALLAYQRKLWALASEMLPLARESSPRWQQFLKLLEGSGAKAVLTESVETDEGGK